jgi:hypothetical protein
MQDGGLGSDFLYPSQFFGRNRDAARAVLFEDALIKFYKLLEFGVMSDGSWPNRTATIIYNVIKALIMHNAERLHLPFIQCLANGNSPMFIDPYNTGKMLHGHCGLLSTVLTVFWHAVRVLHCTAL